MRKILLTGAAGYIGSVLSRLLLERGYAVRGLDNLSFGGESLLDIFNHPAFSFHRGDVRNADDIRSALDGVDAVIHLAAIVGDPACAKQPSVAESTNWEGALLLYETARSIPTVKNFVFASTCSNYGRMEGGGYVNEDSPLNPVSLYARLKVRFERHLLDSHVAPSFHPTALRFATVYGLSPRMRFDLTVNEFVREVALGRAITIFGEKFWRPYCHVRDLALSTILVLEADPRVVDHRVFNVGDTQENYQKKMIAEELLKFDPKARIDYVDRNEDPRDYRVDFSLIKEKLKFAITMRLKDGVGEILGAIRSGILSNPDDPRYRNS